MSSSETQRALNTTIIITWHTTITTSTTHQMTTFIVESLTRVYAISLYIEDN